MGFLKRHARRAQSASAPKGKSLMIATPVVTRPTPQYLGSLIGTFEIMINSGIQISLGMLTGMNHLAMARNQLVAQFLASSSTDLLFVDDDMRWRPEDALKLMRSDLPICAGIGRKKNATPNSSLDAWAADLDWRADKTLPRNESGFVRAKRVGTAFLKINRSVFERMLIERPHLKTGVPNSPESDQKMQAHRANYFQLDPSGMGEDYYFCNLWREIGGEIWVDPSIELGHVGEYEWKGAISEAFPEGVKFERG